MPVSAFDPFAMRRMRSALSLFRPALFDAEFEAIREDLRWFTSQLGEARNVDVVLKRELSPDVRESLLLTGRCICSDSGPKPNGPRMGQRPPASPARRTAFVFLLTAEPFA